MKMKSGKELTQLEIMKRLNTMGIEYNSDIIGKNYYINLYDEAIRSSVNVLKIKKDIEKDRLYAAFYTQKLRKVNECSLKLDKDINDLNYINEKGNKCNINNVNKNIGKQGFFSDLEGSFLNKLIMAQIAYNFIEVNKKDINKLANSLPKILIPIQAIKKYTMINIYPSIISIIYKAMDLLNYLIADKFIVISFLVFLLLIITIFLLFKKTLKNKRK